MTAQPTPKETPKGAWKITFLLFLFMLVNFADKIVVGLAGVPIMTELKLEPEQFGLLGSSFFLLYSISAIVVGFIINRIATRWVLLVLALIWAHRRLDAALPRWGEALPGYAIGSVAMVWFIGRLLTVLTT